MNIFIAGSSQRRTEIHELYKELYAKGHTGYDWTQDPGFDDPSKFDPSVSAYKDKDSVNECDALIWYIADALSEGASFEAGYAHGLDIPVIVMANLDLPEFRNRFYAYACFGCANKFEKALELAEKAVAFREAANV